MASAFPGNCPVCRFWIQTPPVTPLPLIPAEALIGGGPPSGTATTSPPAAAHAVPDTDDGAGQIDELTSRRPEQRRFERSGNFTFRPLIKEDIPNRDPDFEKEPAVSKPQIPTTTRRWNPQLKWAVVIWISILLILSATVALMRLVRDGSKPPAVATKPQQPIGELRSKLNQGAEECLKAVLSSDDPAEIARHVIGGDEMIPLIEERLKADEPFPRLSEADVLSSVPMSDDDIRRGLCGIIYQSAPNDALSLNKPLLPVGMNRGVEGLSLLEGGAVMDVLTTGGPRKALACFTTNLRKQYLDWEIFIQTWDRTLRSFGDGELGDGPMRFRVLISIDKPVFENGESVDDTIIRIQDPLYQEDVIRVETKPYDQAVIALRPAPAHQEKDPAAGMRPQTATVDLRRNPESGRITIERFVCMEFSGLGGSDGESRENRNENASR